MDVELTTVLVAVVVAVGPTLVAVVNGRNAARARREDWARQDVVAAQAAEAAELLVRSNRQVADRVEVASRDAHRLEAKVDQVHGLVNSTLTAALEGQATILGQLVDLMDDQGDPTVEAVERRAVAAGQLAVLRQVLADRAAATDVAAEELRQSQG